MTGVDLTFCAHGDCTEYGVFPGVDETGSPAKFCFVHDPAAPAVEAGTGSLLADGPEHWRDGRDLLPAAIVEDVWHDDVVAGLAAILLDHTAMAMDETPDAVEAAVKSLALASGMALDFAAGLLIATSWLVAAGQLDADLVASGAEQFEQEAEGGPVPYTVTTPADVLDVDEPIAGLHRIAGDAFAADVELCDLCDSVEHTTDDHYELYPLPVRPTDAETETGSTDDNQE